MSFRYNSTPILRNLSFSVQDGEILSILGPNGAGKTTLLKCLNRVLTPKEGTVFIDGRDTRDMSLIKVAKRIGWVPQRGEISRMKVYDLILLGRKPYFKWGPDREDHRQTMEIIHLLGLEALALRYADEISGGEFQLIQTARALAQNPRVILFDEPTSSLDISNQHLLLAKIRSLIHSNPRAAVITMHDINLALRYSDKFLFLKNGYIRAVGSKEIIDSPLIKEIYDMKAQVIEAGGYPLVIPV